MSDTNFGECPICRQGQLIPMKNAVSDELLVMCDDYESQWRSPDDAQLYENALTEEVQVVSATERDIRAVGWDRWRGATTEL